MNRVSTRAELHRRAQHAMLLGAMRTTRARRTPRVKRHTWIAHSTRPVKPTVAEGLWGHPGL